MGVGAVVLHALGIEAPTQQTLGGSRTTQLKNTHAVPLASARQQSENQKENWAGHSSERAVEGQGREGGYTHPGPWVHEG